MENKIKALCGLITLDQQARLHATQLDCAANLENAIAHYHIAKKYTRIDIGSGGRYMVENSTGQIYGIKAYGVIHRGHNFGTLDTIDQWNWGGYRAVKK